MTSVDSEIPESVKECIKELQSGYVRLLDSNLLGMYLHGSIAMGCFNEESSDIDVLVVIDTPLTSEIKKRLGQIHLELSETYKKNIEISVVTQQVLNNFVHPTPFEFHYSDDHKQAFLEGTVEFEIIKRDYDLAAHFVIVKKYGLTLAGESATIIFPDIPRELYLDSITRDSQWSYDNIMVGPDEGTCRVPQYAVLNFCRVSAFIEAGLITSKRSGAEWAQQQLPLKFRTLAEEALQEYQTAGSSRLVDGKLLKEFAEYVFDEISRLRSTLEMT